MGLLDKLTKKKEDKATEPKIASVEAEKKPKKAEKKVEKTETVSKRDGKKTGSAYRTIVRPYISEKAAQYEMHGLYTFVVDCKATKEEIKKAVFALYGVKPVSVRTAQFEGKKARFGKSSGRRKNWKKALVSLSKGTTITIHEGV
jgi:large subunit ribosomal protein L23